MKKNFKTILFAVGFLVFLSFATLFLFKLVGQKQNIVNDNLIDSTFANANISFGSKENLNQKPLKQFLYSILDGTAITEKENSIFAVIIENHPQARPQQIGLNEASIVYEALAEGSAGPAIHWFCWESPSK